MPTRLGSVLIVFVLLFLVSYSTALATVECTATAGISSMPPRSSGDVPITVTNQGQTDINWVRITITDAVFTLIGGSSPNWNSDRSSDFIVFNTGNISPGGSAIFSLNVATGDSESPPVLFQTDASDTGDASDVINCGGSLPSVAIIDIPNPTPTPVVITVTNTITNTNIVSSGDTTGPSVSLTLPSGTGYSKPPVISGQATDANIIKSVDYSLEGGSTWSTVTQIDSPNSKSTGFSFTPPVTKSATYPLKVRARDSSGNYGYSSVVNLVIDQSGPVITLTTDLAIPFKDSPKIIGKLADNNQISSVYYSLNQSQDWIPVNSFSQSKFEFVPSYLEDGNYLLTIRAEDQLDNSTIKSFPQPLIINRIPPQVGSGTFSYGQLQSNYFLSDSNIIVTLYSMGGAVKQEIIANNNSFILDPLPHSHFWSGSIKFPEPGTYPIQVKSQDGAGQQSLRQLSQITVIKPGTVNPPDSQIYVYTKPDNSPNFLIWDATQYDLDNPVNMSDTGQYSLILPPGTYYLKVSAPDYLSLNSNIFTLNSTSTVNADFHLTPKKYFRLGPIKFPIPQKPSSPVIIQTSDLVTTPDPLIQKPFPITDYVTAGHPTLITFLNSWGTKTPSQLNSLSQLLADPFMAELDAKVIVILPQESTTSAQLINSQSLLNPNLKILGDPDGRSIPEIGYFTSPTHYFVNRRGITNQVSAGLLNPNQLKDLIKITSQSDH